MNIFVAVRCVRTNAGRRMKRVKRENRGNRENHRNRGKPCPRTNEHSNRRRGTPTWLADGEDKRGMLLNQ